MWRESVGLYRFQLELKRFLVVHIRVIWLDGVVAGSSTPERPEPRISRALACCGSGRPPFARPAARVGYVRGPGGAAGASEAGPRRIMTRRSTRWPGRPVGRMGPPRRPRRRVRERLEPRPDRRGGRPSAALDDLRTLAALSGVGVEGAVVRRALYAGAYTLLEPLAAVRGEQRGSPLPAEKSRRLLGISLTRRSPPPGHPHRERAPDRHHLVAHLLATSIILATALFSRRLAPCSPTLAGALVDTHLIMMYLFVM